MSIYKKNLLNEKSKGKKIVVYTTLYTQCTKLLIQTRLKQSSVVSRWHACIRVSIVFFRDLFFFISSNTQRTTKTTLKKRQQPPIQTTKHKMRFVIHSRYKTVCALLRTFRSFTSVLVGTRNEKKNTEKYQLFILHFACM